MPGFMTAFGFAAIVLGWLGYRFCCSAAARLSGGGQSATGQFHFGRAFADRRGFAGMLVALIGQLLAVLAVVGAVFVLAGIALFMAG